VEGVRWAQTRNADRIPQSQAADSVRQPLSTPGTSSDSASQRNESRARISQPSSLGSPTGITHQPCRQTSWHASRAHAGMSQSSTWSRKNPSGPRDFRRRSCFPYRNHGAVTLNWSQATDPALRPAAVSEVHELFACAGAEHIPLRRRDLKSLGSAIWLLAASAPTVNRKARRGSSNTFMTPPLRPGNHSAAMADVAVNACVAGRPHHGAGAWVLCAAAVRSGGGHR
jgi:hypothetical protein